ERGEQAVEPASVDRLVRHFNSTNRLLAARETDYPALLRSRYRKQLRQVPTLLCHLPAHWRVLRQHRATTADQVQHRATAPLSWRPNVRGAREEWFGENERGRIVNRGLQTPRRTKTRGELRGACVGFLPCIHPDLPLSRPCG